MSDVGMGYKSLKYIGGLQLLPDGVYPIYCAKSAPP